jgi:hypothetical protein
MPTEEKFPTSEVVQPPLVSTGMSKGQHTNAAIVLAITSVLLGLAFPAWSDYVLGLFFLACAIGLLGEAVSIFRRGEVTVRNSPSPRFIVIRRVNTPARFFVYVSAYALLGTFSFVFFAFVALAFVFKITK